MHLRLILVISIFFFSKSCESASNNSENHALVMVESLKAQLQELESEVQKQHYSGKLKWQVQTFQKWYQDTQKCSGDLSYIFDDWTPVQRRVDGSENFHRNWTDYRDGFGNHQKEFFLGLEQLHTLTTDQGPQELLILLGDGEGKLAYAKYDHFVVAGEEEKYELKQLGGYVGDAGDSLRYHVGKQFSTFDEDNNDENERCANVWAGGWWFGACFESNLNGSYMRNKSGVTTNKGVVWEHWHGSKYSLQFVQMMIKPKV